MFDGGIHIQVLQVLLLIAHDDVNVVGAVQAMVGDGKEAINVRGQVNPCHRWTFVQDYIEEARILVGKAVMVLAPDGRGNQQVE